MEPGEAEILRGVNFCRVNSLDENIHYRNFTFIGERSDKQQSIFFQFEIESRLFFYYALFVLLCFDCHELIKVVTTVYRYSLEQYRCKKTSGGASSNLYTDNFRSFFLHRKLS